MQSSMTIIGRAERIHFVGLRHADVPAKVDTGADLSSVWASSIRLEGDELVFVLFGKGSPYFTGKELRIAPGQYRTTVVENSFGHKEMRYVAKLAVRVKGRRVRATFTLADRSLKTYPVLLGRRFLNGKFLVNVSQGEPLISEEKARASKPHEELENEA